MKAIDRLESNIFEDKKTREKDSVKNLLSTEEGFQDINDFPNLTEFLNLNEPQSQEP